MSRRPRLAADAVPRRGQRPAEVGDLAGEELAADRAERDERQVAGQTGVGPVPAGQVHLIGVDLLHVDDVGVVRQMQVARLATTEHQHPHRQPAGRLEVARVGDDLRHGAESHNGREVGVGRHQHRHRTKARQRRDRHQRTGPRLHQHADMCALPHADLDQAAHHIVDATIDRFIGMHAAVEQQAFASRRTAGLLGHDPAERDPGVVVDLPQAGQPGQRADRLDGQCPRRLVGRDHRVGRRPGQREGHLSGRCRAVCQSGDEWDTAFAVFRRLQRHRRDTLRQVGVTVDRLDPLGHRRPRLSGRLRPDD